MVISRAKIRWDNGPHPSITPSILILESDEDKVVDCMIEKGQITSKKDAWFYQCVIIGEHPIILGEFPPGLTPQVVSCKIIGTKLPAAYYHMCHFK